MNTKRGIITSTLIGNCKKTVEHEIDDYSNFIWCSWYSYQIIGTRTGGLGNNRTGGDHPNYNIVEIGQNTEKSPEDLRRLVITQTRLENHLQTLMSKALNNNNDNNMELWDTNGSVNVSQTTRPHENQQQKWEPA